jgi:hypothetical protein
MKFWPSVLVCEVFLFTYCVILVLSLFLWFKEISVLEFLCAL